MHSQISVLVTGATGNQGWALSHALLERGHRVRALIRDPDSVSAKELARKGASIVLGDFDDYESLQRAVAGVDAVFAMATPWDRGIQGEIEQATHICMAAKEKNVKHLVYSSAAGANLKTGVNFFESKYAVEQRIKALGVPFTIVRPVYFMENLFGPGVLPSLQKGTLALPMPANRLLQQVAVEDIGKFVALVLEAREIFFEQEIDIASDELTGSKQAEILSEVLGRKIEYREIPLQQLSRTSPQLFKMFDWLNRLGYAANIDGLRRLYPQVGWQTYSEWATKQDWSSVLYTAA